MIPAMDQNAKEWLQAGAWIATALGVVVAVWKLRSDARATREQRNRDLRWRQAEAAKKLNDEMMTDVESWAAMQMLDYSGRTFKLPSNTSAVITHDDVASTLNPMAVITDEKEIFIRDCFDKLFYHIAMLEHYISSTLIRAEDVAFPIEYYVPLLAKFKSDAEGYQLVSSELLVEWILLE